MVHKSKKFWSDQTRILFCFFRWTNTVAKKQDLVACQNVKVAMYVKVTWSLMLTAGTREDIRFHRMLVLFYFLIITCYFSFICFNYSVPYTLSSLFNCALCLLSIQFICLYPSYNIMLPSPHLTCTVWIVQLSILFGLTNCPFQIKYMHFIYITEMIA